MLEAEIIVTAPFYDVDPMNVVWHGNYVRYLEDARCALLDRIGYNYKEMYASGYSWPIVDMRIKYVQPIRLSQSVRVVATLKEFENRIKIEYRVLDRDSGSVLTKAHTIQVAVSIETEEMQFESPAALTEKVRELL